MRGFVVACTILAMLCASVATAGPDQDEPVVPYVDEAGTSLVGLLGTALGPINQAAVPFVPNATYPRLQLLLDYEPASMGAELPAGSAFLLFEFHVNLRDGMTNETIASFDFVQPGQRTFDLNVTRIDGRSVVVELVLDVGVLVDWHLRVYGWRGPIPL